MSLLPESTSFYNFFLRLKKPFDVLFSLNHDFNILITHLCLRLKLWVWLHHLKNISFVTYTKTLHSNSSNSRLFIEQIVYFRNERKLAIRPIVLSPVWRTFKPGLYKGDTTVTFVVLSKNPVVLSEARTCSYFKINIDFQPILKVKLVDQLGHQYSK